MTSRKFDFSHLTPEQLDAIAVVYPDAVETVTIRKPVYRILAMLATCRVKMPDGIELVKTGEREDYELPAVLGGKKIK
jgi:hypothetical protein